MFLSALALQTFRAFTSKSFSFENTTVLVGQNGVGKTSIIEAISLLSTVESFRANKIDEMVQLGQELGRVKGKILENRQTGIDVPMEKNVLVEEVARDYADQEDTTLEITLTRGEVQGRRTQKRLYSVNDVRRRKKDFVGNFYSVTFRPEDLRLIEGSPSRRRGFIDTALSVVDYNYAVSLKTYQQTLLRRNKLLQQVREGEQPRSTLAFWNNNLIKHGEIVQKKRTSLFHFLQQVGFPRLFSISYKPSLISLKRAEEYQNREIAAGHSLIGPHKDDFVVLFDVAKSEDLVDLSAYGSRGQQRLGVLWLKIGELQFISEKTGVRPVLLLDDIMSELDVDSRDMVLELINKQQTIITTARSNVVELIKTSDKNLKTIQLD